MPSRHTEKRSVRTLIYRRARACPSPTSVSPKAHRDQDRLILTCSRSGDRELQGPVSRRRGDCGGQAPALRGRSISLFTVGRGTGPRHAQGTPANCSRSGDRGLQRPPHSVGQDRPILTCLGAGLSLARWAAKKTRCQVRKNLMSHENNFLKINLTFHVFNGILYNTHS